MITNSALPSLVSQPSSLITSGWPICPRRLLKQSVFKYLQRLLSTLFTLVKIFGTLPGKCVVLFQFTWKWKILSTRDNSFGLQFGIHGLLSYDGAAIENSLPFRGWKVAMQPNQRYLMRFLILFASLVVPKKLTIFDLVPSYPDSTSISLEVCRAWFKIM